MNLADRVKNLWTLFTKGPMSRTDKIILALAALYCLSPIDAIPDVAPVIGFLDDLLVMIVTLRRLSNKPATPEQDNGPVQVDAKVV